MLGVAQEISHGTIAAFIAPRVDYLIVVLGRN
jgi:hypothetical protein